MMHGGGVGGFGFFVVTNSNFDLLLKMLNVCVLWVSAECAECCVGEVHLTIVMGLSCGNVNMIGV